MLANSSGPIYRDQGWAGFTTFLNLRVVESDDDPDEQYYIYTEGEVAVQSLSEMMRAARVLDRLYLMEIPFLLIYSDADVETVHIGWGIHLAHIDDWFTVLKEKTRGYVVLNRLAYETMGENTEDDLSSYNLNDVDISKLHEAVNFHVFFLREGAK